MSEYAFAVRTKVIKELLEDEEWTRKLEDAKTMKEVQKVLEEFARDRGYKVRQL